jgi:hypothetical protein
MEGEFAGIGYTSGAVRRILGVLSPAKKYGVARVDDPAAQSWQWVSATTTSYAFIWNGIRNRR